MLLILGLCYLAVAAATDDELRPYQEDGTISAREASWRRAKIRKATALGEEEGKLVRDQHLHQLERLRREKAGEGPTASTSTTPAQEPLLNQVASFFFFFLSCVGSLLLASMPNFIFF